MMGYITIFVLEEISGLVMFKKKKQIWRTQVLFVGPLITSFKARVDPPLMYFVTCM